MLRSQKISAGPTTCELLPRSRRIFVCGAWFRFGEVTMCKTHLDKTLDPTLFSIIERSISQRLGFGRRLAPIAYSSAWHPYSALCPTFTGLARTGGRRAADGEGSARAFLDGG